MVGMDPRELHVSLSARAFGRSATAGGRGSSLAADPPIILMDEPFGALDPITRSGLQREFLSLKTRIRKTIVFVTHDISEAVILGDRIAVMHAGALQQVAPPEELVAHPRGDFVSEFLGKQRLQLRLDAVKVRDVMDAGPDCRADAGQGNRNTRSVLMRP